MNLISNNLYHNTYYEPTTGSFYRKENEAVPNYYKVFPDELKRIQVAFTANRKYTYKGAANLAWEFINGPIPEGYVLYFKNMDKEDLRANNLGIVTKDEYKKIKDALYNLQGSLKIIPDKKEVYTYKVKYKENGYNKIRSFQDCIAAKKFHKEVMLKSVRELGKYAITQ